MPILHVVQGNYGHGHGWEDVTQSYDPREAIQLLRAYRTADPETPYRKIKRREKKQS